MASHRLYRSRRDKVIAGVCGGLAQYFEVDATLVRIIFAILFFSGGVAIPLYGALWLVMPKEPRSDWSGFGAGPIPGGGQTWSDIGTGAGAGMGAGAPTGAGMGGAMGAGMAAAGRPADMPPTGGAPGATAGAFAGSGATGESAPGAGFAGASGYGAGAGSEGGWRPGEARNANPDQPFGPMPWLDAELAAGSTSGGAAGRRRPLLLAAILIGVGVFLLLHNFGFFASIKWSVIWPAVLIVLGVALLVGRKGRRRSW